MRDLRVREGLAAASTNAGLYNPVYYLLVGAPALLTD